MTQPRVRRLPVRTIPLCLLLVTSLLSAFELNNTLLAQIESEYGSEARERLIAWQSLYTAAVNAPVEGQLKLVNSFFNRVHFISDLKHWGQEDYWATPVEMLATNGADCEDFSIAKYLTLKSMGVPDDQMRITYVKALEYNQAHMVLAWYPTPDADPLILDNLINEIKPASQRPDLEPVYSFNGEGLWLSQANKNHQRLGGADRLSRWTDLYNRLRVDSLR
ncbi:transglutaminase-like cysteine peptidase [Marinobacter sp. X15-166B]|uniref:transglutaminase-like cysteine peptidase n=1 Tax=Marinobacter sp. X15-166B TaxID=1897620 RepID=UPI00085C62F7|nr:transglutaminase-like cysteine peptidase [Marinobacter sp. X15-166B]OEY67542.1 sulfate adenylyltransferase [Marinobacter sp. X15-166B]